MELVLVLPGADLTIPRGIADDAQVCPVSSLDEGHSKAAPNQNWHETLVTILCRDEDRARLFQEGLEVFGEHQRFRMNPRPRRDD